MNSVSEHAEQIEVTSLCQALGLARASYYRAKNPPPQVAPRKHPTPERALSEQERQQVLDELRSDRFVDMSPVEAHATLLDEGIYYCSVRTMYRILDTHNEVRERRRQTQHPKYVKPQLVANSPNQVWSWDITKLLGPVKWTYFYLYVVLDIYSRYVVGWMLAERESATLAERLLKETCQKQEIVENQLTLHADRGSSMRSKTVALMLSDLGVTKTHSRPHVSNDNPFSESQFKTMKYRPGFPKHFGSIQDARAFCQDFFFWYNNEHRHSGIGLLTPQMVHYGHAEQVLTFRQETLNQAFQRHPERFVNKKPKPSKLPEKVWINPPEQSVATPELLVNFDTKVSQTT